MVQERRRTIEGCLKLTAGVTGIAVSDQGEVHCQVKELGDPGTVYRKCLGLMAQLANLGLVHCDFNEFNLLVGVVPASHWAVTHT